MRPKKVVQLVVAEARSLEVLRFVIQNTGRFRVIGTTSVAEAMAVISITEPGGLDLVACDLALTLRGGNELVRFAKEQSPALPVLIFSSRVAKFPVHCFADALLLKDSYSSAALLEKIIVLTTRKRGPKRRTYSELQTAHALYRARKKEGA